MVADLGRYALEVEDEQDLLDFAVKVVAEGLRVPIAAVLRVTDDADWLQIEASTGWDEAKLASRRVRVRCFDAGGLRPRHRRAGHLRGPAERGLGSSADPGWWRTA